MACSFPDPTACPSPQLPSSFGLPPLRPRPSLSLPSPLRYPPSPLRYPPPPLGLSLSLRLPLDPPSSRSPLLHTLPPLNTQPSDPPLPSSQLHPSQPLPRTFPNDNSTQGPQSSPGADTQNHGIFMHRDISRSPTIAFQVTTFPDVAGDAPSHTYRFLLDAPIAVPSYLTGLHASTLPTSWSSWRSSSPTIPLTQTSWARRAQTHTT